MTVIPIYFFKWSRKGKNINNKSCKDIIQTKDQKSASLLENTQHVRLLLLKKASSHCKKIIPCEINDYSDNQGLPIVKKRGSR